MYTLLLFIHSFLTYLPDENCGFPFERVDEVCSKRGRGGGGEVGDDGVSSIYNRVGDTCLIMSGKRREDEMGQHHE